MSLRIGLSKKTRLLCIVLVIALIVAVVILGFDLKSTSNKLKNAGEEVARSEAALKAVERERDDKANKLAQTLKENELLKERLTCCVFSQLMIEKLARKGTYGDWKSTLQANPGDFIQFRIIIRGVGKNVSIFDNLSQGFTEVRNLRLDGKPVANISSCAISIEIGNVYGQREVSFEARINPEIKETITLVNEAGVSANCLNQAASSVTIEVKVRSSSSSCCWSPPPPKPKCPTCPTPIPPPPPPGPEGPAERPP